MKAKQTWIVVRLLLGVAAIVWMFSFAEWIYVPNHLRPGFVKPPFIDGTAMIFWFWGTMWGEPFTLSIQLVALLSKSKIMHVLGFLLQGVLIGLCILAIRFQLSENPSSVWSCSFALAINIWYCYLLFKHSRESSAKVPSPLPEVH